MTAHNLTKYAIVAKNHANQEKTTVATYATKGEANRALRKLAKQLDPTAKSAIPWLSTYDDHGFTVPVSRGRLVWSCGTVDYKVDRV